jgi:hypothetical protein
MKSPWSDRAPFSLSLRERAGERVFNAFRLTVQKTLSLTVSRRTGRGKKSWRVIDYAPAEPPTPRDRALRSGGVCHLAWCACRSHHVLRRSMFCVGCSMFGVRI